MLHVTINGRGFELPHGGTVLDALHAAAVEVPTLCHDPRLKPVGACRLCVVEVKGWPRPVTACTTPIQEGMEVQTHIPEIEQARRTLLRLLVREYPREMTGRFPDKEFHRYLRAYRLEGESGATANAQPRDDSHPYIRVDMSQCIYCYRCVRICEEVQGQFVWRVWNRGDATRIVPDSRTTLLESSCVSCGACVDTCPTGALEDKTLLLHGVPTNWEKTTCPYCGTGCEMHVGTRDNRIVTIRPALEALVSKGHLCVKGRYAFDFQHASDRITRPMIREKGQWQEVSWADAITFVATRIRRIVDQQGPDSVGILGSARATNEENYLAQKFARLVLGTNNVDCCARVCRAPSAAGMKQVLGTGAATNSLDDIEKARIILVCGANPTENHPIVGARIKQAALRGAHLIVIDPRRIELAEYADIHLALRPGTNVALLNALACAVVEEDLCDAAFLQERVSEWEEFQKFIRSWAPERVSGICGIDAGLIRRAARLYATSRPAICFHGLGLTEHIQGTDGVMALVNLALLTGNIGKPGAGMNPLRGQNNVQGAAHMGCEPGLLTGAVPLEESRHLFETVWGAPLPQRPGLNLMQMMDAATAGRMKALWAIGYDVLLTNPSRSATSRALKSLALVIVQDLFLNETARELATVFLPAASPFEKDGTFMNGERRIQRVRKVVEPTNQAKADWEILCDVARAMGRGKFFDYGSAREIWDEVRAVWPKGKGITYDRIEEAGLHWPCSAEDHPGTQVLHIEAFASGKRAPLQCIEFTPTTETITEDFPFLLTTGRTLYQFNAGTMTLRTPNVTLHAEDFLDVSPQDAGRLELSNGQRVRLVSRYGQTELAVRISDNVRPGQLFATFHTAQVSLNFVTSPHRDRQVDTPEYKVTAVRIEKL
ncbi:MAG: formate dehydrogenase subunit alpha [Acidobacteria bacterium]|nr:formate dehydrogenase subunit alpha [Acidobacteriota bacterium]